MGVKQGYAIVAGLLNYVKTQKTTTTRRNGQIFLKLERMKDIYQFTILMSAISLTSYSSLGEEERSRI